MGKILDFIKEHKIIAAVSGLVLVLIILILILMLMSGGKTSLAGNPDSRYPYTISVTAKGLELTVRGDFPKGYSWEGESENGNIISLSKTSKGSKSASFLIGPVASGAAQVRFYLYKEFIPELPDEIHEITVSVYVDENGQVSLVSHSDNEKKGLLGEDTDTFSYRVGERPDGTLLVWVDNSKLHSTWTTSSSTSSVIVAEKKETLSTEEELAKHTATEEELAAALALADADIKEYGESTGEEEEDNYDEEDDPDEENDYGSLEEIPDTYLYTVSYVRDGNATIRIRPAGGENEGFAFTAMALSDGTVTATEAHLYGQKALTDENGNAITDAEGNPIYLPEADDSTSFDFSNRSLLGGDAEIASIPVSLRNLESSLEYFQAKAGEEEVYVDAQLLTYTDASDRTWNLYYTPYADEDDFVGSLTAQSGTTYNEISLHGYVIEGKTVAIWEQNWNTYLLQATDEETTMSTTIDQAENLITELKSAE